MANEITATGNASEFLLAEVLDPLVIDAAYGNMVILPNVYIFDLAGRGSLTAEFTKWPVLSASDLTDGTDLTSNTDVNVSSVSATADEAGLKVTVTRLHLAAAMVNLDDYATQLGRALAQKIEIDLAAEFADFTTSVGTTTADLTAAQFLSAIYNFENKNILSRGEPIAFLHPIQVADLRTNLASLTGTLYGGGNMAAESAGGLFGVGAAFDLFGVEIFTSTNCASVNTDADRQGAMFPRDNSICFSGLWAARVDVEYDASLRGWELVATSAYGDENIDPAAGIKIISDHE